MPSQELVKHYSECQQKDIAAKEAIAKIDPSDKKAIEKQMLKLRLTALVDLSDAHLKTVIESYGLPLAINHALSVLTQPVGAFALLN